MSLMDWLLIIVAVLAVIIAGLYFLNRWASKKMTEQNDVIEKTRQTMSIYVIDKKKGKAKDANFPKAVMQQLPKMTKLMTLPLVKAKIGPQIMTLICDKRVFKALPLKKTVKVDLAGMYIVDMKGLKTEKEYKESKKKGKGNESTKASKGNNSKA